MLTLRRRTSPPTEPIEISAPSALDRLRSLKGYAVFDKGEGALYAVTFDGEIIGMRFTRRGARRLIKDHQDGWRPDRRAWFELPIIDVADETADPADETDKEAI